MAEELTINPSSSKEGKYKTLLPQVQALLSNEEDTIANLANMCSAFKYTLDVLWVGFYIEKDGELVLGPFQGPIACTRIALGKGVCGTSFSEGRTIIVEDVDQFPGHIACSPLSKSEIVVPVWKDGEVKMVLDIDSEKLGDFSELDQQYLEKICNLLTPKI